MTALALPDVRLYRGWAEAVRDFGDAEQMHGSGYWNLPQDLQGSDSPEACAELVRVLAAHADPTREQGEGRVPSDYYWITDGGRQVLGFVAVRHRLNEALLESGGHIGYSVRPTARRSGHATRALRLALGRAGGLGIARALITADDANVASWSVIEAAGGELDDIRDGARRYWVPTSPDVSRRPT